MLAITPEVQQQQTDSRLTHLAPLDPNLDTLPKNFVTTAKRYGSSKVAIRKKRFGLWQEYTWEQSLAHMRDFCLGLVSLGLRRNDKVSIIGDNDPEFYWAELAVQAAGGTTIGIFADGNLQEIGHVLNDSDSVFVVAHDQEQCDKMLDLRATIPQVRNVIYWDEDGLWSYTDPWLLSFPQVEELGRAYARENPNAFESLVAEGSGSDVAILSYTSGTTSLPKGAMISHANLIYGMRHYTATAPIRATDNYVSFSPLAWITEQSLGLTCHICNATVVNFPENSSTVQTDIREIAPSSLLFPSRLWESLISMVQVRMTDASWLNRTLYKLFMPVGYRVVDFGNANKPVPPLWRALYQLGQIAIFGPLRDKLGMVNIREAYTSGASLSPDVLRWFHAIGVRLKNLYGSTECQTHTLHYPGEIQFESVGKPPPGVEIRIGEDGEIHVRSRSVFQGYYKAPDATARAIDPDGWFRTGDAGYLNDRGHLIYLDRVKDLIELANGERFSPQFIETRLKFSHYIQEAMSIGSAERSFVSAIVVVEFDSVAHWAEKNSISFTTLADLSQRPEVYDLIRKDVERVNATLPEPVRIKRFVILPKAFDADEAELTRTRKLRRGSLATRYENIIEAIYAGEKTVSVHSEVKYRDGRTGHTETTTSIADV